MPYHVRLRGDAVHVAPPADWIKRTSGGEIRHGPAEERRPCICGLTRSTQLRNTGSIKQTGKRRFVRVFDAFWWGGWFCLFGLLSVRLLSLSTLRRIRAGRRTLQCGTLTSIGIPGGTKETELPRTHCVPGWIGKRSTKRCTLCQFRISDHVAWTVRFSGCRGGLSERCYNCPRCLLVSYLFFFAFDLGWCRRALFIRPVERNSPLRKMTRYLGRPISFPRPLSFLIGRLGDLMTVFPFRSPLRAFFTAALCS